jgi:hypothetical protein
LTWWTKFGYWFGGRPAKNDSAGESEAAAQFEEDDGTGRLGVIARELVPMTPGDSNPNSRLKRRLQLRSAARVITSM